jgi:hypothetical protein
MVDGKIQEKKNNNNTIHTHTIQNEQEIMITGLAIERRKTFLP